MAHTDPERLALMALGDGTAGEDRHVTGCPRCRAELDQLTRVVAVARSAGDSDRLQVPSPALWGRVALAAGVNAGVDAGQATGSGPAIDADRRTGDDAAAEPARHPSRSAQNPRPQPAGSRRRPPRRRTALAAAALVIAAAIGAGAWAGLHALTASRSTVVARIALRPLPEFPQWHAASGTAVMAKSPAGQQVTVTLNAPDRTGFYEVWLLARDGHSMISLGDLGPGHQGTFTMPPGVDLGTYSRLDISLQAFNGSTVHARASVVRGALPSS